MAMTLRLTPEEAEALRETARRERRSMQDVARTAIREYVDGRRQQRAAHLTRIVAEDAELLRRLGGA
jgi:predicted transcriptional regulator